MAKEPNYYNEETAALLLQTHPKTLRVYVYGKNKQKEPYKFIRYKKINRDVVVYSKSDIDKILNF